VWQAFIVWSAWQPFERGYMWWRQDIDWAYVIHWQDGADPQKGDWTTGGESWKWDDSFPDGRGLVPPAGRFEPVRGFGFVWFNFLGGPSAQIGWGTDREKGFCANVQAFERGTILHSSTVEFCDPDHQYNSATDPAFAPLFFSLGSDGYWRRH
jgi:hypothetical protein